MEEHVKQITDMLVDSAKAQAAVLAKELNENGQLSLPQQLAGIRCTNDDGDTFIVVIGLDLSRSTLARQIGATNILFYVFHDDKYVVEHYTSHSFGRFDETVGTDAFRQETKKLVTKVIIDEFKSVKVRIDVEGICNIDTLLVPEKVQRKVLCLADNCTLSIQGKTFEGAEGLKEYVREQTDSSQPYILDRCQRFPCFDAEDYANEYRFYRNFLVCRDKQEANRKAKQMEKLPHFSDFCLVTNELPDTMRPMVYYKDETMEMTLAY